MTLVTTFIQDLGNYVFIPAVFFLFMLLVGCKFQESFIAALKIGIGFIALTLVINYMLEVLQPAIVGFSDKFDSSLSAIDVGGMATAVMGFSSSLGALIIPICVAFNIVLLLLKITDTVNVDVFNLHQNASVGAIVYAFSGNFIYGVLSALIFHLWALLAADIGHKKNQDFFDLPEGIVISHPVANTYLPFAIIFEKIFDLIGFRTKKETGVKREKPKLGILEEPMVVGFLIGMFLGGLGFDWKDPYHTVIESIKLGMNLAAVMLLMPRMSGILLEGLIPLSEAAKVKLSQLFPNRNINIGMDSALIVGRPEVMAPALLTIPFIVLLAIILPGNKVMPLGDLSQFAFFIACMVPVFKGDYLKTLLTSVIVFGSGLYIASWLTPATTEVFQKFGVGAKEGVMYSSLNPSANPFTGIFALLSQVGYWGYFVFAILLWLFAQFLKKVND